MRYTTLILFCSLLIICSCNEADVNYGSLISGKYVGIYTLIMNDGSHGPVGNKDTIYFYFTNSGYNYYAKDSFTPPGGTGSYIIDPTTITFTDTVGHPGDINPSLLLNGRFIYTLLGRRLMLSRYDTRYNRYYKLDLYKQL